MNVLCHAGPWSDSYLRFIVDAMYPGAQCTILSGHKSVDRSGLCEHYYSAVKVNKNRRYNASAEDLEIVARCRLLRALDLQVALLHLNCMRRSIASILDDFKPNFVLTETIDSYIMDLLDIESKKRSIPCIGLVTVFVNGYFRVSIRGEYVKSRVVNNNEASEVLNSIDNDHYVPSFVVKGRNRLIYNALRCWLRNIIKIPYFQLKRLLTSEFYNYHYWQSYIISKQWFAWFPEIDPGSRNWLDSLQANSSTVIYLPLQMFPEATIDYWCESKEVIEYENFLVAFVKKHSSIVFLVKEHPNVVGYRSPTFYRELKSSSNVIFCPTSVPSNSLQDYYDATLVWTGSAGFESAIRGKPVLCASRPYYFTDKFPCFVFNQNTETAEIECFVSEYNFNSNKKELVRYLLEGCLSGRVRFDGTWSIDNMDHVDEAKKLAESLKGFIERKYFANFE